MSALTPVLPPSQEPVKALPGLLHDVAPEHIRHWYAIVRGLIEKSVKSAQNNYFAHGYDLPAQMVADGDPDLNGKWFVQDWLGFPQRYEDALGRLETENFLLHHSDAGIQGRQGHEEYIEWRDVRDQDGKLLRVEMTTETQEYWSFLASVDPNQTLQLLADFARVQTIDPRDVYGAHDPFANTSTPELRLAAFHTRMLREAYDQPVPSPYNNGALAIAFMANTANSLAGAINLTAFGGVPFGTLDCTRPLTAAELTETLPHQATAPRRTSDPLILSAATRCAWEGRKLALADPAGFYINEVGQGSTLLLPDGETPIPQSWFKLSRGCMIERDGVETSLFQRLVVEPDIESGLVLGDLYVAQTGRRVHSGADIARLVSIALHLKTSRQNISCTYKKIGIAPVVPMTGSKAQNQRDPDVRQVHTKWRDGSKA